MQRTNFGNSNGANLEEEVERKWNKEVAKGRSDTQADTIVLRSYTPEIRSEVRRALSRSREKTVSEPRVQYKSETPSSHCNSAVDPFTHQRIPEDNLVSYVGSDGERHCFNIYTLYANWKHTNNLTNPITNEPLPSFVLLWLQILYKPVTVRVITANFDEISFTVDPLVDTVVDKILRTLSVSGDMLENLMMYDIFTLEGKSLYTMDMNELVSNFPITYVVLKEFKSERRMRVCVQKLSRHLSRRSDDLAVEVSHYVNSTLLKVLD